MMISAVCVTYGRTALLSEAVACFLSQSYKDSELVILNTCPQQTLLCDIPGVRAINCAVRPPSLGAARNMAISEARGGIIVTWDSDDLFLPGYLNRIAWWFSSAPHAEWVQFDKAWLCEGWKIRKHFTGWANGVFFKKSAWEKIGGYADNLTVGEDRQFVGRLTAQCKGVGVELMPEEIGAVYVWGNGAFHVSGLGEDKVGQLTAYQRAEMDLRDRIRRNEEPTGVITLNPWLVHDPAILVKEHALRKSSSDFSIATADAASTCLVQLGRFGDIINILPVAKHLFDTTGEKPRFMVSQEFASVLDGCSYLVPVPVKLTPDRIMDAMAMAKDRYDNVIQCQIWGKGYKQLRRCPSFNIESWNLSGYMDHFYDPTWPLVFDQRNRGMEALLVKKFTRTNKPKIAVNTTRAFSAPFSAGHTLRSMIDEAFGKQFEIVDIAANRLDHVYDVIAFIEASVLLITIDTSTLHLAAATRTPMVCLVRDGWEGAIPRYGCAARINYSVAMANPRCVIEAAKKAIGL